MPEEILRDDWEFETTFEEELEVGDEIRFEKIITRDDVEKFAMASGDTNPVHTDEDFMKDSEYGEPIVHGILVTGVISSALGHMSEYGVYRSQEVEFKNPVYHGDTVEAVLEVSERETMTKFRFDTKVYNRTTGELAVDGEAVVIMSDRLLGL